MLWLTKRLIVNLKSFYKCDVTVDHCADTSEPGVNTSSVDWKEELPVKCIQSVTSQNVEPDDNCHKSEKNEEDAIKIDSKSAVNSGKALVMLDKFQVSFEENDAKKEVLRNVTSLTRKSHSQKSAAFTVTSVAGALTTQYHIMVCNKYLKNWLEN